MGLNIVRFEDRGMIKWGILRGDKVLRIEGNYGSLASFLKNGIPAAKDALLTSSNGMAFSSLNILSPVTTPAQIVCQGANYSAHREEAGLTAERPPFNLIFTKAPSSLTGPYDDILCPDHIRLLDYEIEVGLVIRQEIAEPIQVTPENFHEYIAGFVIANDVSARDTQLTEGQWFKGKSFRTFCPVGPFLYLIDDEEGNDIHNLELTLSVNGEVRQSAHTKQLLYKPEETLTSLSEMMSFYPGDLLLTGTPGGVAMQLSADDFDIVSSLSTSFDEKRERLMASQQNNPRYLKDGDLITCEVKSSDGKIDLGKQENKVVFIR